MQSINGQNKIRIHDAFPKIKHKGDTPTYNGISFNEEKVGPSDFKVHALIGKGSFGEVYLVEKLDSSTLLAMKVLHKSKIMSKKTLVINIA